MAEDAERVKTPRSFSERQGVAESSWHDYCLASHRDPDTKMPALFAAGVHMGIAATHRSMQ